jgi:hypothetical protein
MTWIIVTTALSVTAEYTDDDENRDELLDYILTIEPLTQWPPGRRKKLWETCEFLKASVVTSQRNETHDGGGD